MFKKPLTAADIKAKALELGADLVGIADGAELNANPPDPANPKRPSDITDLDADRVIVLAKRSLIDLPTIALALATVVLLWRFKKLQEPVIVAGAAVIGLIAYPLMQT